MLNRVLQIDEKFLGPEHRNLASTLNNLGSIYHQQLRFGDAERVHKRALAIREKALGPDHLAVATSLNNLAELYRIQGRHAEAESQFKRALAIREKALGPEHPDVAQSLNNLAALHQADGKYAEAEPQYERALAIRERALGPEHPDVAQSLNNLASLYHAEGKYAEAEPLYHRSLAIWDKALGSEHPRVAMSRDNIAALDRDQGKAVRFRAEGEAITEIYRGVNLVSLPPPAAVRYDISLIDQREALAKVRQALDLIYQKSPFNADTIETLKKVGDVVILYDPSFPWTGGTRLTLAGFIPVIPDPLRSGFPNVFGKYGGGKGEKTFFAVLGRYVIKHPLAELAVGGIVHELVGHGVQHLHGRLEDLRELDAECEASLYELNAFQDLEVDKLSRDMVLFRKELEEYNCDDFKRYMRKNNPSQMKLWDELNVDVTRVLTVFEEYLSSQRP